MWIFATIKNYKRSGNKLNELQPTELITKNHEGDIKANRFGDKPRKV